MQSMQEGGKLGAISVSVALEEKVQRLIPRRMSIDELFVESSLLVLSLLFRLKLSFELEL